MFYDVYYLAMLFLRFFPNYAFLVKKIYRMWLGQQNKILGYARRLKKRMRSKIFIFLRPHDKGRNWDVIWGRYIKDSEIKKAEIQVVDIRCALNLWVFPILCHYHHGCPCCQEREGRESVGTAMTEV